MARLEFQFRKLDRWPRAETPADNRKGNGVFRSDFSTTLRNLAHELHLVGAINPVLISTMHDEKFIRIDGLPRVDQGRPKFQGVVLEFMATPGRLMFACDSCVCWEHNLHAIAYTMERLRDVDRYGAAGGDQQYAGFKALPPPGSGSMTIEQAARFLADVAEYRVDAVLADPGHYRNAYRRAAAKLHPDANGGEHHDSVKWASLQQAQAVLDQHHQHKGATP